MGRSYHHPVRHVFGLWPSDLAHLLLPRGLIFISLLSPPSLCWKGGFSCSRLWLSFPFSVLVFFDLLWDCERFSAGDSVLCKWWYSFDIDSLPSAVECLLIRAILLLVHWQTRSNASLVAIPDFVCVYVCTFPFSCRCWDLIILFFECVG